MFDLRLRRRSPTLFKLQPIARRLDDGPAPLTFEQERLWFVQQLFPEGAAYNISNAFRFAGHLDLAVLARSLEEIVRRHEILRTSFQVADGRPVQVARPPGPVALPVLDLRPLPPAATAAESGRAMVQRARQPFDLEAGPLLRVTLVRVAEADYLLLVTMHHIVTDWWSFALFRDQLVQLYAGISQGRVPDLGELPIQFADFASWQRRCLDAEVQARELAYWRGRLAGAPAVLELPVDRRRPAVASFRGARSNFHLSPGLSDALRALGRRAEATPFTIHLAAFAVLLRRWAGPEDLLIGTPIADRNRPETEHLIGYLLNLLVLRADLRGDPSFDEVVGRVREEVHGAYAHQDLSYGKLLEELRPARGLDRAPLFQVAFIYVTVPEPRAAPAALSQSAVSGVGLDPGTSRFDLTYVAEDATEGFRCFFEYSTDLFEAATLRRLAGQLETLLAAIVAAPGTPVSGLPLLSAAERWALLAEWNDTAAVPAPPLLVHRRFAAAAARRPDAVAVAGEGMVLTYAELDAQSNRLARYLRRLGVGPGTRMGLALGRSPSLVVALLGVLKAGGAYLPLDPGHPRARLDLMLEDARAHALLADGPAAASGRPSPAGPRILHPEVVAAAARAESPAALADLASPEDLAYVLFTSGSTGRPKGVEVSHRALVNLLDAVAHAPDLAAGDRLLAVTPLTFDIAALEIFLPLLREGCVELAGVDESADGARLAARLARSRPRAMQATPAAWRMLLDLGWPGDPELQALCGGEALSPALAAALAPRVGALWNVYGPTETTVWSTAVRVERAGAGPVSIGRPLANTLVLVLDPDLQPAPIGVPGDLYIGGEGLARGYLGRPDLTAERFLPAPSPLPGAAPGSRLYRTGDRARVLADGRLDFLGRVDHQVKVRGFRVELGEIESVLERAPGVREAAVVVREAAGDARLVAYLATGTAAGPGITELRSFLGDRLPAPMVPNAFVRLESLPHTASGKVDRRALPAPDDGGRAEPAGAYVAPRTELESTLAALWQEVLACERVGVHDNLFELGAHSLLLVRLRLRYQEVLGADVSLPDLFRRPTVSELAAHLSLGVSAPKSPPPILPRRARRQAPAARADRAG